MSNTGWLLTEKLVRSIMTLTVGAFVVRYLGPEEFGTISYSLAIVGILHGVCTLGIEGVLVRELGKLDHSDQQNTKVEKEKLITAVFFSRVVMGLILLLITLFLLASFQNPSFDFILIIFLIGFTLVAQGSDTIDLFNQSQLNSYKTAIAKITSYIITNSMRISFILLELNTIFFAFTYAIEVLITSYVLIRRYLKTNKFILDLKYIYSKLIRLLYETWPIIFASLSTAAAVKIDQIYLRENLGSEALGMYSAAIILATASFFVPGVICNTFLPLVTSAKKKSYKAYIRVLRICYLLNISIAIVAILFTWLLAETAVEILYGKAFTDSVFILKIYSLINIPVYIGVTHSLWVISESKTVFLMVRAISGALLTYILCQATIPVHGVSGAAFSVVVSQVVTELLMPFVYNRKVFCNLIGIQGLIYEKS